MRTALLYGFIPVEAVWLTLAFLFYNFLTFGFLSFSSFCSLKLFCSIPCSYWQSDNFSKSSVMMVSY